MEIIAYTIPIICIFGAAGMSGGLMPFIVRSVSFVCVSLVSEAKWGFGFYCFLGFLDMFYGCFCFVFYACYVFLYMFFINRFEI